MTPAEHLARRFHETYERLAPTFGYTTREETRAFDPTTPNGRLMVAVCAEITDAAGAAHAARVLADFAKTAPGRLPQRVQDAIDAALANGVAAVHQRVTPCKHCGAKQGEEHSVTCPHGVPTVPAPLTFNDGWQNFICYLVDHCEGDTVTEEGLQRAAAAFLREPRYAGARGVDSVDGAQRLVDECAPFLKEGETPAECIARNRKDAETAIRCYYNDAHRYQALRAMWLDREGSTFATMEMCRAETADEFDKALDGVRGAGGVDSVDGAQR